MPVVFSPDVFVGGRARGVQAESSEDMAMPPITLLKPLSTMRTSPVIAEACRRAGTPRHLQPFSARTDLGIGRLGESDIHCPQCFLAANGEVCREFELL